MKDFLKYTGATIVGLIVFSLINMLLCVLMMAAIVGALAAGFSSSSPAKLEDHSVYVLDMKGTVIERSEADDLEYEMLTLMGQDVLQKYGLNDILASIKRAKDDPKIDGIYLRGGALAVGPASAEAIRRALVDFKSSGKFVVAYADQYGQNNYYLASCADRVMVNPDGSLDWKGVSLTLDFYTRLLEKVGVEMQVVKVGTFKSAVEPYILTGMSDANRLQYTVMANDLWQERLAAVSVSRNIPVDSLNALADRYMAVQPQTDYVTTGLVDTLCYTQDVDTLLASLTGTEDYHLVTYSDYLSADQTVVADKANVIAVLYAEGDITDETGEGIVGKDMVETINQLTNCDSVKAVVLRVNSGGGSAYASEQIHHALTLLKAKKPLVVSMGDYAASGGYYISCPANYIYAEQTTLTGSIGIFGMIPNFGPLANKVGIDFDGVKTNAHGDFESNMVTKGMNPEERELMQAEINRGYDLFTRRCAEGRGVSQDSIKAIGEGRVWMGSRALTIGLVDSLGGMDEAIHKAQSLANLADDDYSVVDYPEQEDMLTTFLNAFSASVRLVVSPKARAERLIENRLGRETYQTLRAIEAAESEPTIQARIPYIIEIH